jgi:hypothetical protein
VSGGVGLEDSRSSQSTSSLSSHSHLLTRDTRDHGGCLQEDD